jgi:hypothetical protein
MVFSVGSAIVVALFFTLVVTDIVAVFVRANHNRWNNSVVLGSAIVAFWLVMFVLVVATLGCRKFGCLSCRRGADV